MALTTSDFQEFTDAEVVTALRQAYVHAALSQTISTGDRAITRAKLADIGKELKEWEMRVEGASNNDIVLVTMESP